MKVRLKRIEERHVMRLEGSGAIDEIDINEDIASPDTETISIYWRGENASGIIDFLPEEVTKIASAAKKRASLVKGVKRFKVMGKKSLI